MFLFLSYFLKTYSSPICVFCFRNTEAAWQMWLISQWPGPSFLFFYSFPVSVTTFINCVDFLFEKKLNHIWLPQCTLNAPRHELKCLSSFSYFKGCIHCCLAVILWHTDCQMVSVLITPFKKSVKGKLLSVCHHQALSPISEWSS